MRLFRGARGDLEAYKIKTVLFLYAVGFLAATQKYYTKERRKIISFLGGLQ